MQNSLAGGAPDPGQYFDSGFLCLGLETSCDETSAAVVAGAHQIRSNVISSQIAVHQRFGGVVPEIAARRHLERIVPVVEQALQEAHASLDQIGGIAVSYGPGLVGALLVGVSAAKGLALALGKPFIGVHHVEGHIYANFLVHPELEPPALCLTVSGGHTDLVYIRAHGEFRVVGRTRDDAAGEAFDKVARLLGLGYPGGPAVEAQARQGDPQAYPMPRALAGEDTLDFSFSGLKTAVARLIQELPDRNPRTLSNLCASFQAAVVDVLVSRTVQAMKKLGVRTVLLSGGVAANGELRRRLEEAVRQQGGRLYMPPAILCTDNAAMVACAGTYRLARGERSGWDLNAVPSLALPEAPAASGASA